MDAPKTSASAEPSFPPLTASASLLVNNLAAANAAAAAAAAAVASPPSTELFETPSTSNALPSLAPPPRPSRRPPTAAAPAVTATSVADYIQSIAAASISNPTKTPTTASHTGIDLFGSTPFAPVADSAAGSAASEVRQMNGASSSNNGFVAAAATAADDPFGNHDDLFGMTPFQNEMQVSKGESIQFWT